MVREAESSNVFSGRVRPYSEILNDWFDPTPFMNADRLFEFVCAGMASVGAAEVFLFAIAYSRFCWNAWPTARLIIGTNADGAWAS